MKCFWLNFLIYIFNHSIILMKISRISQFDEKFVEIDIFKIKKVKIQTWMCQLVEENFSEYFKSTFVSYCDSPISIHRSKIFIIKMQWKWPICIIQRIRMIGWPSNMFLGIKCSIMDLILVHYSCSF